MEGKLYGVGVGSGDPELLTLKAKRIIETADVVAVPVKQKGGWSTAYHIIEQVIAVPPSKLLDIEFAMGKDPNIRKACREEAARCLMELLDQGRQIAMITLGDVAIYSTSAYILDIVQKKGYAVEMVSGIPSFCAGAAKALVPLVEGEEGLGIIPLLNEVGQVERALEVFENIVIMKASTSIRKLYKLLKEKELLNHTVVISNVGMEGEYIGSLDEQKEYGYFTTIIIRKKR